MLILVNVFNIQQLIVRNLVPTYCTGIVERTLKIGVGCAFNDTSTGTGHQRLDTVEKNSMQGRRQLKDMPRTTNEGGPHSILCQTDRRTALTRSRNSFFSTNK